MLRLLERWPTRDQLASLSHQELVAFARAGRHGWPKRFADKVTACTAVSDDASPASKLTREKKDCGYDSSFTEQTRTSVIEVRSRLGTGDHVAPLDLLDHTPTQRRDE